MYIPVHRSLAGTASAKASRYRLMGLASIGAIGYYLAHKNPFMAGIYSIITIGYLATAKDYEEEA